MEGIANVTRQQQSHVNSAEINIKVAERVHTQTNKSNNLKDIQKEVIQNHKKVNSKEDMQNLVKELNDAMAPISTSLHFGVDSNDVFYVAVVDSKTDNLISRFPVAKALDFLPKMKEVTGILFDSKG